MKKILLFSIVIVILVGIATAGYFAYFNKPKPLPPLPMQSISFNTSDGVTLVGNYLSVQNPKGAVLLLHMMPTTKESWVSTQQSLGHADITSLAIDLRGHGSSTKGPGVMTLDYHNFSDEDHQASRHDVTAGIEYLVSQGFDKDDIAIMGASIGANLALQHLALDPDIRAAVLLSPSLNYHGVEVEQYARSLAPRQAVYYVASKDDEYAYTSARKLYEATSVTKEIVEFEDLGHGTAMLEKSPELIDTITTWIASRFE